MVYMVKNPSGNGWWLGVTPISGNPIWILMDFFSMIVLEFEKFERWLPGISGWFSVKGNVCVLNFGGLSQQLGALIPTAPPADLKNLTCFSMFSGWWFGTSILFSHILGIIIPIDFHIFQRGSNHQPVLVSRRDLWAWWCTAGQELPSSGNSNVTLAHLGRMCYGLFYPHCRELPC